jgi:hypothetical protein
MNIPIRQSASPVSKRRLSAQPKSQHESSSPSLFAGVFDRFLAKPSNPPSPPPPERRTTFRLQDYLPQPLEEKTITDTVDEVQVHLEGHVNWFYGTKAVPISSESRLVNNRDVSPPSGGHSQRPTGQVPSSKAAMSSRSSSSTNLSNSIQSLSASSTSADERRIKSKVHSLIADKLITAIQPTTTGEEAVFLPEELTLLLSALPHPEDMEDDLVLASALSQWRTLSWYLLYHKKVRKNNEHEFQKRLSKEIDLMLETLDNELEPYIDESKNEQRVEHLRSLMEKTADLGRLISSQATVFEFSWDYEPEDGREPHRESRFSRESLHAATSTRKSRTTRDVNVLFPALLKTSDQHGIRLKKPVCICKPQTERVRARLRRKKTEEVN